MSCCRCVKCDYCNSYECPLHGEFHQPSYWKSYKFGHDPQCKTQPTPSLDLYTIKLGKYYIKVHDYHLRNGVYYRVSTDNKTWVFTPISEIITYCQINEIIVPDNIRQLFYSIP